jgi:hypothetical protein
LSKTETTTHLRRRRRRTYVAKPNRQKYKPGHRFVSLVILERLAKAKGSQYVRCACDCGNVRDYNLSNLISGKTTQCSDRTKHVDPRFKGDDITYDGAHNRVKNTKGSAREHACWKCERPAQQWAYSHADPDAKRMGIGRNAGYPYSPAVAHYLPMCRPCHRTFDGAAERRAAGDRVSVAYRALWLLHFADETDG